MKIEIAEAIAQLSKEKNVDRTVLAEILQNVLLMMIKKKYGTTENFDIFVNVDKGEIEIYQNKVIVNKVKNATKEIDLETARKLEPDLEIGDEYVEILAPQSFGRRLIIAAKQNLSQRLRDLEKKHIYEEYVNRVGEIIVGDIRQINRDEIYLNVDKTEVILPKSEQIPTERYKRGKTLRSVIKEVRETNKGPEIIVSRRDPRFLLRLLEIEVPEIYDGIIEVKSIAREAGERSKVAVYSNDKRIDAVGACVGMKGIRIQAIVKELNNERIDVINWSSEPQIFVTRALSPAKPSYVIINEETKTAVAIVPDDQISLAIGKGGTNRRLASQLTGYEIETIKESDYKEMMGRPQKETDLSQIPGVGKVLLSKLEQAGFHTAEEILKAGKKKLLEIPGIGEKKADKIFESIKNCVEK
ncbi:transcription termination/antitermination protein NusA [candidate division KSB1 bacterium]|nr:MAG: transcription termination/antitermination protein NusA [candidate division KSB1 bacterium 4484_219]RKY80645.1 MAG: transcription termination/antitermination protein NusA [candidate division KSB1 bacterium]RKY91848.1 MAG: transcription termination/antitermination protein NusA [candidate division KSB1 bacterium]